MSPNTCACPSGWTGSTCSQRELYMPFFLAIYLPLVECQCFAVSRPYYIARQKVKHICTVLECDNLVHVCSIVKAQVT